MAKKKAGIFDPWRQERAEPVAKTEPLHVDAYTTDSVSSDPSQPIRFAGHRGGVTVWVPSGPTELMAKQAQTNLLAALLHLMANRKLYTIFNKWGLRNDRGSDFEREPWTVMHDGTRTVVVRGDYARALDAVTFALREASRTDVKVEPYLLSLGVRPYIV